MRDTSLDSKEEVRNLVRAGRAAVKLGDYEAARTTFERAVALEPGNVEAQDGLRDVQRRIGMSPTPATAEVVEYCYRHPETETGLHCVQCGRPICVRCSSPAAVGQLCPDCRRGRRAPNYQLNVASLAKGGAAAFLVSALVSAFIGFVPFFFMIFLGPAIGEMVMRAVDSATRMKRGRPMQIVVAAAIIAGTAAAVLLSPFGGGGLSLLIFLVLAVATAVTRLR
jgi:hypothetical protein